MFLTPNVRTDVVEANHVLTQEPVTRLVTSWARDTRAHANHTSREGFAKPVSLVQIHVLLDYLSDVAWNLFLRVVSISGMSLSYLWISVLFLATLYCQICRTTFDLSIFNEDNLFFL